MERKFKILVVDDDIYVAFNLQDILETEGYSTRTAASGQTTLTTCREKVFDLALIDIRLPDIGGIELIEKLAGLYPKMEYIIITGYASIDTAIEVVGRRKIIAYETKPLNMDRLLALIKQVAERKLVKQR